MVVGVAEVVNGGEGSGSLGRSCSGVVSGKGKCGGEVVARAVARAVAKAVVGGSLFLTNYK